MDIEEIRTFVAIAQLGGFTRAAGQLHRSQPAISRRIGLLEQELGTPLLERERGGVKVSAAGQAFLPFAEAMLAAIKDGQEAVHATVAGDTSSVSLALVGTLADTHIVDVLRKFASHSKGAGVDLRTANSQEVSQLVRRGDATLGLRYFADDRAELISTIVASERMLVICSPRHRLAGHKTRAPALRGERWIGFPAARGRESFGHVLARRLLAAGLEGAPLMLIDSLTAQKRLVEAGFGIGLVPESSVRDEIKLGSLKTISGTAVSTRIPIALVQRRKGYLNAAARALVSILSGESKRLDGRRFKSAPKA